MLDLDWHRPARIVEVRERIWAHLSPASRFEPEGLITAAALLKWPSGDASRLAELQFLLSDVIGEFLDALPRLMRRLTTSIAIEEEWSPERLRGPVHWSRTYAMRAATGNTAMWVTTPARRVFQTPENELLVHVLDAVLAAGRRTGWTMESGDHAPVALIRGRLADAERWQHSRVLGQIYRVRPSPLSLARIRSARTRTRYFPVLAAYDKWDAMVNRLDRQAVREAVEGAGLVTADEATLFELLALFAVIDALSEAGWNPQPLRLFRGKVRVEAAHSDGRRASLSYQTASSELTFRSIYREVLKDHAFLQVSALRPDFALTWQDKQGRTHWLIGECKLSQSQGVAGAARSALLDLMAYRRAFRRTLDRVQGPYGLGVAWGAQLHPSLDSEIMLCTPDTISQAITGTVT